MTKITYDEYLKLARDPLIEDETLLSFSILVPGDGGFDFTFRADPDKVNLTQEDLEFEDALQMGNLFARYRRQAKFRIRKRQGSNLPVLVSEGDSWFQFPLLVREIIDQLEEDYLIWSIGASGDTARNMVFGVNGKGGREYLNELLRHKESVQGFLFSAAGNDVIGQDPETKRPVLLDILKDFNGNSNDVEGHIDHDLLSEKLAFLRTAYTKVIEDIRVQTIFKDLPIFIHGYDYAFPYPWGDNDPRNPKHADHNEWLGRPFSERNIHNNDLRRNIIKWLIDKLYTLLAEIAGDSRITAVWLIDCRNAMPNVEDWVDEIHGTSQGFEKVAARFKVVIDNVI